MKEIKAQIEILESLLKDLCICELTEEGRIVINRMIIELKKKLK